MSNHPGGKSLRLIHRASGDAAQVRHLGPYAIESLIRPDEEGAATVYRVRIEPRQTTSTSYHLVAEEFYFVLAGHGTALLDGHPRWLQPGDLLRLPQGTRHAFQTEEEALDMLNIHTPGCRPDHDVYFADGPPPEGFSPPSSKKEFVDEW